MALEVPVRLSQRAFQYLVVVTVPVEGGPADPQERGDVLAAKPACGTRNHEKDGHSIMLFCRLNDSDRSFWFLGPATYQGHVGEKPMAITWKLHTPLSGDLYQSFAAAVA